jgi:uncharacterized membrane protein
MPEQADELRQLRAAVEALSTQLADVTRRLYNLEHSSSAPETAIPLTPSPERIDKVHRFQPRAQELESRFGLTIVNRVGAITLAIGIVFFFKYAVDNKWITASGRVVLGLLSGIILIGVADWLRKRGQRVFAQGVCGCGLAILYISLYASFAYYQLVPQAAAFVAMAGACAFAVVLSFRYDHPAIAALGLIGAFLTPPLLENGHDNPWLLFPYLLILDIFSLGMAIRRGWPVLQILAFAGTAILFMAWASAGGPPKMGVGFFFLCVFFALFFGGFVHSVGAGREATSLVMLAFNAFWALLSSRILAHGRDAQGVALFALALALIHLCGALGIKRGQRLYMTLYVIAHACLLDAAVRELYTWAAHHIEPAARASFLSESVSVFLALYAVAMITSGVARAVSADRVIGLFVIGFVIAKLYLYDVWLLSRFYRITAFVALGTLLLIASYAYSRFRDKLEAIWRSRQ